MTMFGANPEQLEALGRNLQRQIESINGVLSTVTSTLGGTTWLFGGPRSTMLFADRLAASLSR